jgi:diacylglycerol kinase
MTPIKRYLIILLFLIIGIGFGIGFGAVFYIIRKKKDDQITMGGSIKDIIIPSIFFWVTIGILIIVKMEYCIPLQLFIFSAIVLAGFLSAISCKKALLFFLCFGIVIVELMLEALIRRFVKWINSIMYKNKSAIIVNFQAPNASAPQISNLNNENQKNIYNATHPSAPSMNNSPQPRAPPMDNKSN